MKHFWHGFKAKDDAPVQFKKHVIILFWNPESSQAEGLKDSVRKLSLKYPSVKVKMINVKKDPTRPIKYKVNEWPSVVLLKDGREVERVANEDGGLRLEQLFRKAHV